MVEESSTDSTAAQDFLNKDPVQMLELVRKALQKANRSEQPMEWADLQGALGASLVESTAGAFNEALMNDVLAAYRSAQSVFDPVRSPEKWLLTERNIGATYVIAIRDAVGDSIGHVVSAIMTYANAFVRGERNLSPHIWDWCEGELVQVLQHALRFDGPEGLRIARACELALAIVPENNTEEARSALRAVFDAYFAKLGLEPVGTVEHMM